MFSIFPSITISLSTLMLSIVSLAFLLGFGLYVAFAFIVVRQIEIMRKTVETPLSPVIRFIGYVHFVVALLAFIFVYMMLQTV